MIVTFSEPTRIKYPFYYNEQKVTVNAAKLLYAGNYIKDAADLSMSDKLSRFHLLQQLNALTARNTLHTVLSFHPSEQIPTSKMIRISIDFMDRIGFGRQPYLVYQHFDAAHPHIHIVSTNITSRGLRIDMNRLFIRKGREACRNIEEAYDLRRIPKMQETAIKNQQTLKTNPLIAEYGGSPTAETIEHILEHVFNKFNFTSIPELNAILRLYRCKVETGRPSSILHEKKGVIYRITDSQGRNIGAHVNSHSLASNSGLTFLENLFLRHTQSRTQNLDILRARIDYILLSRPTDWPSLTKKLKTDSIHLFPYADTDNQLYGLCFTDLKSSTSIAGGSLGPRYTSTAILVQLHTPSRSLSPNSAPPSKSNPPPKSPSAPTTTSTAPSNSSPPIPPARK